MTTTCYIWGAGGHGRVVLDTLQAAAAYSRYAFLDGNATLHGTQVQGVPVVGGVEALPPPGNDVAVLPAMGDNFRRLAILDDLLAQGYSVPVAIHPSACVSPHATLAPGVVVFAQAVVQAGANVGRGSIMNTAASIDHDCLLGACVHCSPGVRLAGGVEIGNCTHLGIGAVVIQEMRIGCHCVIGAAAAVVSRMGDGILALGVPAKVVRKLPPRDLLDL